jgi:hypothetical protein
MCTQFYTLGVLGLDVKMMLNGLRKVGCFVWAFFLGGGEVVLRRCQ